MGLIPKELMRCPNRLIQTNRVFYVVVDSTGVLRKPPEMSMFCEFILIYIIAFADFLGFCRPRLIHSYTDELYRLIQYRLMT